MNGGIPNFYNMGHGNDILEITGSLQGSIGNIVIHGNNGDDILSGITLADGGLGNDELITFSTSVSNAIYNHNYSYHYGTVANARLSGGEGDDKITGGAKTIIAAGGDGDDIITGSTKQDWIWGDQWNSLNNDITTNYQSERISSDGFIDAWSKFFTSGSHVGGNDTIDGGLGDDYISGGQGNDKLTGGGGNDTIDGDSGNDVIDGGEGDNTLSGGTGDDTISAGDGNDTIYGADGNDIISAGDGNNNITAEGGNDTITTGVGADVISGGDGDDTINSGRGNDNITAGDGADTVKAGGGDDRIGGGLGDDVLYGEGDNDTIEGHEGDDLIYGGDGIDILYGNEGNDKIYAGDGLQSHIEGGSGDDLLVGGVGDDAIYGHADNDDITGDAGDDTLDGGGGADTISAGDGNDKIYGGDGVDTISGGAGNDVIYGNSGADIISGGAGSDTFIYGQAEYSSLADTITDFSAGNGGDKIDLTSLHKNNKGATFPADDYPFSLGYIKLIKDGVDTLIGYDEDGFNAGHNYIQLARLINVNPTDLTPENFIVGSAEKNYGFQRNGAVLSILNSNDLGKIKYQVRLWGGSPSEDVKVIISNKDGSEITNFNFNSTNWSTPQSIELSASNPRELNLLNLTINSNDVNYQGTGITLGINDGELLAQRNALSQAHIPAFKSSNTTKTISLSSNREISNNQISEKIKLIPISGPGNSIDAKAIINGSNVQLVLEDKEISWVGSTTYVAESEINSKLGSGFRVTFEQIQDYKVNLSSTRTNTVEGSGGGTTEVTFNLKLDSVALSDLEIKWETVLEGVNSAQSNDFLNNNVPSGVVKIEKGNKDINFVVEIKEDLIKEIDEDFKIKLTDISNQNLTFQNNLFTHTISNDDFSKLTGTVNYWKNNTPLKDIKIGLSQSKIDISSDGQIIFKDIVRDESSGTLSASMWANSGSSNFENINFEFNKNSDSKFSIDINNSLFTGDWLLDTNDTDASYSLSAIKIGNNNTEAIKIADIIVTIPNKDTSTAFLEWGLVGETALEKTQFNQILNTNLLNGQFEVNSLEGEFSLEVSKDDLTGLEERAIDSLDALMALKMSSGSIDSNDIIHGAQWMAADVDNNGLVQAKDAWLINKYNVGKSELSSSVGQWEFINKEINISNLGASNATPTNNSLSNLVSSDAMHLDITALINGDIDGSYINFL